MKKLLVLLMALAVLAPAFADDAKVLPKGVLRLTFVFANNSFNQSYDGDGEAQDSDYGKVAALVLGTALEYGVTDQIAAAVQWTPAYVLSSSFETDPLSLVNPAWNGEANADGLADLFIGAKVQILGAKGFIPTELFRLAFATGVLVPLDNPDWTAETASAVAAGDYKIKSPSNQAVGLGFRAYFDWVINKMFYLNLYNQTIIYLPVTKADILKPEGEYKYGYKLTFEVEPHFDYSFSDKVSISAGVPVTFTMGPEVLRDDAPIAPVPSPEYYIMTVSPSASVFVMAFMPFELKAGYTLPLLGKNADAASTLVFQLKTFLKF